MVQTSDLRVKSIVEVELLSPVPMCDIFVVPVVVKNFGYSATTSYRIVARYSYSIRHKTQTNMRIFHGLPSGSKTSSPAQLSRLIRSQNRFSSLTFPHPVDLVCPDPDAMRPHLQPHRRILRTSPNKPAVSCRGTSSPKERKCA